MANSNVRSSAYRAAGGWKQWGQVKGSDTSIKMDAPKPAHIVAYLQECADKNDEYMLTKAEIRATLEADMKDFPVTVIDEGVRAKKAKKSGKKVLTKKKKASNIKPNKPSNRAAKRELEKKVEKERLAKRKQFK